VEGIVELRFPISLNDIVRLMGTLTQKTESICYVIGQISPNLFKVDVTTYRSSMLLNEVSSL
jgi:hypothetical protein